MSPAQVFGGVQGGVQTKCILITTRLDSNLCKPSPALVGVRYQLAFVARDSVSRTNRPGMPSYTHVRAAGGHAHT